MIGAKENFDENLLGSLRNGSLVILIFFLTYKILLSSRDMELERRVRAG